LGTAMLAAVGAGMASNLQEAADAMRGELTRFEPKMKDAIRSERLARWKQALAAA